MNADLMELRDRLAKATGPDWKLDHRLAALIYGYDKIEIDSDSAGPRYYGWRGKQCTELAPRLLLSYTASLDAAVTLLEPWMEYTLSTLYGIADFECPLNAGDTGPQSFAVRRKDGNVVLAICQWRINYEIAKKSTDGDTRGEANPPLSSIP